MQFWNPGLLHCPRNMTAHLPLLDGVTVESPKCPRTWTHIFLTFEMHEKRLRLWLLYTRRARPMSCDLSMHLIETTTCSAVLLLLISNRQVDSNAAVSSCQPHRLCGVEETCGRPSSLLTHTQITEVAAMPGVKVEPSQSSQGSLLEAMDAEGLDTFVELVQRQASWLTARRRVLARSVLYCIPTLCAEDKERPDRVERLDTAAAADRPRAPGRVHSETGLTLASVWARLFACPALLESCWLSQIADVLASRSAECSTEGSEDLQQVCGLRLGSRARATSAIRGLHASQAAPYTSNDMQAATVLKGAALVAGLMLKDHAKAMPEAMVEAVVSLHDNALLVGQP